MMFVGTAVITGGSLGLGLETARHLVRTHRDIVIVGRDRGRLTSAANELRATGATVDTFAVDLLDNSEVRGLAAALVYRKQKIDVLVNNAGAAFPRYGETPDSVERTYSINHHASFLLTHLLLASSAFADEARIINVSSATESRGRLDRAAPDVEGTTWRKGRYFPPVVYGTSKLLSLLATRELAARLPPGMSIYNADPGRVRGTQFNTRAGGLMKLSAPLVAAFAVPLERGVRTNIRLATSLEPPTPSGGFFAQGRLAKPSRQARDDTLARLVYDRTAELLRIQAPPLVDAVD
ncbi:SDR family NAD(P)-dependent oxidoreductase [Amycolatopsis azurea]|uniref:SDR family NAD(P)-dependent oxidoreductase n=1 Tax=Amycolatopsis azurea TaxID=36819 RepID=UPI003804A5E7